jgi:hypothetical protein
MQVHALSSQISSRSGVVKEAQEFCPGRGKSDKRILSGRGKSERIWSHLRNMPALESEVEHAYNEEDPASDKQTSKYE